MNHAIICQYPRPGESVQDGTGEVIAITPGMTEVADVNTDRIRDGFPQFLAPSLLG
jgi:hypothetical protein